jgi:hypothetical protein
MSDENDKLISDDWEMTAPNVNVPKQEKQDDWSMPAPVFRVSEGEKIENLPKRSLNFNQIETNNFDQTAPNLNLSELSPPYPYNSAANPKQNVVNHSVVRRTEESSGSKLIYVLGGLILSLFFAIAALAAIYFLFLRQS